MAKKVNLVKSASVPDVGDLIRFTQSVFQTAANADKVAKITATQFTSADMIGMRIHEIRWHINNAFGQMTADGDDFTLGLMTTYNNGAVPTSINVTGVIDHTHFERLLTGAGLPIEISRYPIVVTPSTRPLVHPASLYYYMQSDGFAAAMTGVLELIYTLENLDSGTYDDLLRQMISTQTI
jgi:hypothetical protein